jgi:RNA polymerase-binding transcription factor DksA
MATKKATSKKKAAANKASGAKKAAAKKSPAKKKPSAKKAAAKKKARTTTAKKKAAAKKSPAKKKNAAGKTVRRNGILVPAVVEATGKTYPFDVEFLERQKAALLEERARYMDHAEKFEAEADALARDREPGDVQFDDESGEGDSIAVERERDLALSAQARQAVEEIDAALARLAAGTYGLSVVSGLPIPKERLEAIPEASLRVEEKSGSRWR